MKTPTNKTQFIKEHYNSMTDEEIGGHLGISSDAVYRIRKKNKLFKNKSQETPDDFTDAPIPKVGLETRGDHIVINWTTKTMITELGEYGQIVCSFDMHSAVQRSYVTMGEGMTASRVAEQFDFPHAKAVHLYAKHHGFTKSSLPQTDLEFEMGLTEDEAVQQNIQTMKRNTYKKTEKAKWMEIQKGYEKWINFHHNVLKPFENFVSEYLPSHKVPAISVRTRRISNHTELVGMSDWHYMKLCYDHTGKEIYNRQIAIDTLQQHIEDLIAHMMLKGKPEKIILPIGSDNIHVDNQIQTTTAGTNQSAQTEGSYRIDVRKYIEMQLTVIDMLSQVAPVELVPMFGNHDKNNAYLLQAFLEALYKSSKRVRVNVNHTSRTYYQDGCNCYIFDHGDTVSLTKKEKEIHKVILAEAKQQGINVSQVENYFYVTGHIHLDYVKDLGGKVKFIVLPSMTPPDDWHYDSFYVGTKQQTAMHTFDKTKGLIGTYYAT